MFFFFIYVIGLLIFKDYGLTLDDEHYRINGVYYKNFIKQYLNLLVSFNFTDLKLLGKEIETGSLKNHPVIFETILAFLADILKLSDTKSIYNLSHLLNFSIYSLSLFFFYKIIKNRYNSEIIGLLAILIIFVTPRFFAESFYNSRDIFFFSLFIFFLYTLQKLLNKNNTKNIILLSFTSALLINAKILGIIPFIVFLFMYIFYIFGNQENAFNNVKKVFTLLITTFIFIVILWPYLWFSPIENFIKGYSDIIKAHNNLLVLTYFSGEYLSSTNTPWFFRIFWFFITTPLIVVFIFALGFVMMVKKFISKILELDEKNSDIWKNKFEFFDFYTVITLVIVVFLTIKFNESQFNGWRHLYFLYASIIFIFTYGYKKIQSNRNKIIKNLLNIFIILSIIYNSLWIFKNHPYQNNYFNIASINYSINKFDLDYWGLSNYQAIKYILENDDSKTINISSVSFADLETTILKLDLENKKRINIVHDFSKADYIIDSYMKRIRGNFSINQEEYAKYYDIKINKSSINTVYKKNRIN